MPTIVSHAAVPLAIGLGLGSGIVSRRLLLAGVAASIVPDLDVLAFRVGIAYGDAFGHRGFTHSIGFACVLAFVAWLSAKKLFTDRVTAAWFVGISTLSHGLLDMLTNGGHGVALWWPISTQRIFAPWRVIEASPLSLRRILGGRGVELLQSEMLWVWLPAAVLLAVLWLVRRARSRQVLGSPR